MSAISSSTTTPTTSTASTGAGAPIYSSSSGSTVAPVQSSVGPVSGINYQTLVTALVASQQLQVTTIQNEISADQTKQGDYQTLAANLSTLATSLQTLGTNSTFQNYQVQTSDDNQLSVTATSSASPGSYQFQSVQLASSQVSLSQGFANATTQTIGTGTLTIANGGGLAPPTLLDALNGDQGVQLGSLQITDAAGHTAEINLSTAYTVNDVLNAINNNGVADVTASTDGGHIVLTDSSGGSGSLTVANLNGDQTATNLGINQTSSSGTITGQNVYQAAATTDLSQINDGNGIYTVGSSAALAVTLSSGTTLNVNLSGASTVGDVVNDINNATGNNGSLVASIVNGALQLTDNSGGSGTLSVADENGASVVNALGLNVAASGNTITGKPLLAGINSVLLSNLNGGQGITQTGEIELQDRTGQTATINLTGATSLDQVINAINNATTTGGQKLDLSASIDSAGTGIEVTDTSGSTADNLVIQDVGGSTLATQLGIATNSATSSIDSGNLNLQYVSNATSLSTYAPDGAAVPDGSFTITNSAGKQATITVNSSTKTLGDVINLINSSGLNVTAQLNSTGDGFTLTDNAGGTGQLTVTESDGNDTAADLRIAGTGTTVSGHSVIDSRQATVINVTSGETLDNLVNQIGSSGIVSASVVSDGSPFNPDHLALTATTPGQGGQFFVSESGINLGLQTTTQAQNALLLVGTGSNAIIQTSSTNTFNNALPGLNVQLQAVGTSPDTATVSQNTSTIVTAIQSFVSNYNNFITQAQSLTSFNTSTDTASPLQGSPTVSTAENELNTLITQPFNSSNSPIQTLVDLGITVNSDGSLSLNTTQLQTALQNDSSAVTSFFTTASTGFAAVAQSTLTGITDPNTGTFTLASNVLQDSINNYQTQITDLNAILTNQEQQLTNTFANLETFISQMQDQSNLISALQPV
ncbi:MAG TPA: flagellar filament capping protein FliD, partial [Planctomycetaceae bacterium]|nr:flagellar filament capping protein FliD [Planctomycetaceae bacterium]